MVYVWESDIDRDRVRYVEDSVRRRTGERLKSRHREGDSWGKRGRGRAIQDPQIFAQPHNLKQRPLKSGRAGRDSSLDGYGGSHGLEGR